ncbi:MAG: phospholipase C [Segniliparus sp.]|uniref:phospholipase C n=1 Tax=Segniliparus sp. TaxID=2804064 RepID=UPI003F2CBE62
MTVKLLRIALVSALALALPMASSASADESTSTPIKHLVVIFPENISFDHYFATYPHAANADGEKLQGSDEDAPKFVADPATPTDVATLEHDGLLGESNPNAEKPFRLAPDQAVTCDQNHEYDAEQRAANGGKMDQSFETASKDKCSSKGKNMLERRGLNMGYYDGNTVAALWNYAQHYALNDNSYSSVFGPSTPGHVNLVAGTTYGIRSFGPKNGQPTPKPDKFVKAPNADGVGTMVDDPDPAFDDCSNRNDQSTDDNLAGFAAGTKNVGDQLNEKGVSWGWFQAGFRPSSRDGDRAICKTGHKNVGGNPADDYSPHHQPFQYFQQTANPHHLPPKSPEEIGHEGQANHQYDLADFQAALSRGDLPAVSFVKPPQYQDGHAGYSDPIDEGRFIAHWINALQQSPAWKDTAIVIAYDDSDGWYDHKAPVLLNGSDNPAAYEEDPGADDVWCRDFAAAHPPLAGQQGRCGPGTRQPLLVVSPYAKRNFVDHTYTEQTSVTKFIQDNWGLGRLGPDRFDERAQPINEMFDFAAPPRVDHLLLREDTGAVAADGHLHEAEDHPFVNKAKGSAHHPGTVAAPWWQQTWAIVAGVVVLVLVAAGLVLLRRRGR